MTNIYTAALTGGTRNLPYVVPFDSDIEAFRRALHIDPLVPATYVPLMRAIGAYPYVLDNLPFPVPPPEPMPAPHIEFHGLTLAPAWITGRPPTFVHRPTSFPLPTVWSLTKLDDQTARLTNDAGLSVVIPCYLTPEFLLVPGWPSYVGSTMGVVFASGAGWAAGYQLDFHIPPTGYPFAEADRLLAAQPFVMRLLASAGAVTLHASLLRPQERLAVVAAAVVKRFVIRLLQVSDGLTEASTSGPQVEGVDPDALDYEGMYERLLSWTTDDMESVLTFGGQPLAFRG